MKWTIWLALLATCMVVAMLALVSYSGEMKKSIQASTQQQQLPNTVNIESPTVLHQADTK